MVLEIEIDIEEVEKVLEVNKCMEKALVAKTDSRASK